MELGLAGRAAVVGGASSGLGRAIAEALAAEGCRLLLWSRRLGSLAEVGTRLASEYGVEVHHISADATDPDCGATVAAEVAERLGGADVLVLNAGGPPTVDPTRTDPDAWQQAVQLLALTPIDLATRLLPGMRERGWGRVVAVLSSGVRQPIVDLVYSNAGRSVLAAWLKTTARTVAPEGVTLNGILPGRIDTPRVVSLDTGRAEREGSTPDEVKAEHIRSIPAGRYGQPEELAALAAFLASDRASYVTGQMIAVDGGLIAGL